MVKQEQAWNYWRLVACLFAFLSLLLSFLLRQYKEKNPFITIGHEIAHWASLLLAIGALSRIMTVGVLGSFGGSLEALLLISLATFLAGIYIDATFLFLGTLMGCFALVLSYISMYTYFLFIPVCLVFLLGFYWFIRKKSHQMTQEKKS